MPIRSGPARRAGVATTVLVVAMSLAACSGDDDDSGDDPEIPSEEPTAMVVTSRVTIGEVSGRLPKQKRNAISADVGKVVTDWIEAAYFDGAPQVSLGDAFPGFTKGAAALARRDRWLMSNATLGGNVEEVVPVGKVRVAVDMLAVKGRVAGATGRFKVVFDTVAERTKRVTVRGRVALSRNQKGNWQIFAYDAGRWTTARKGADS